MYSKKMTRLMFAFDALPESDEKEKVRRPYLNDEEGIFDFLAKAEKHLDNVKPEWEEY